MATTAPAAVAAQCFSPIALLGDEALALRVRAGDEGAFEELYRRHHPGLYRYCASVLGDPHEAEEALQWTMLGANGRCGGAGARSCTCAPGSTASRTTSAWT